jgi:hypothetical protein
MGGLAGHMSHLYENPNLSFSEIKDVLQKASSGELTGRMGKLKLLVTKVILRVEV